ncbi:hypothetical protein ES703_64627 [subsurface metagenome]
MIDHRRFTGVVAHSYIHRLRGVAGYRNILVCPLLRDRTVDTNVRELGLTDLAGVMCGHCQSDIRSCIHINRIRTNLCPRDAIGRIRARKVTGNVTLYFHPLRRCDIGLGCIGAARTCHGATLEGNTLCRCNNHHSMSGIRFQRITNHNACLGPYVRIPHTFDFCYN